MAQIQSPETYADGQQVTAARLNNQTNGATLLPGAVTDQTAISGGVASGDSFIVHDASTSALRKATAGEVLGAGIPVVASSVTGVAGADLLLNAPAGREVDVVGNFQVIGNETVTGNQTVTGNSTITGTATLNGSSVANGSLTANAAFNSTGTANFTGTLQVGGTVGYVLYEVTDQTITPWEATAVGYAGAIWTSSSFTKPSDEIWRFEVDFSYDGVTGYGWEFAFRYSSQTARSGQYLYISSQYSSGVTNKNTYREIASWSVGAGTAISATNFTIDAFAVSGSSFRMFQTSIPTSSVMSTFGGTIAPSKFRIYKYKTA